MAKAKDIPSKLNPEQEALLLHSWAQKLDSLELSSENAALIKRHKRAQSRALNVFRARCMADATRYGQELQGLLREQTQDHVKLQADPNNERLQESCKVLGEEINRLRLSIDSCNKAQGAQDTAAFGAFVDLTLEKYPERLGLGTLESDYGMEDVYTVLIGLVVGTLGVLAMLYLFLWSKEVRFECIPPDDPSGRAVVRIHNESSFPVDIIAPLEGYVNGDETVSTYGLEVQVKEKGEEEFQPVSPSVDAWTYQGTPSSKRDPVRVAPNLSVDLTLSLKSLEKEHPKLSAYRIVGKDIHGRVVYRFEQAFMN